MTTLPQTNKIAAWYQAVRPRVFTATYVPLALAGVIAVRDGAFNPLHFLLALIGTMLLQTTANLVNEYADFQRGADTLKQAGQSMTIKQKLLTPREVLVGAILTLAGGVLIGLFLLWRTGPPLLWIGLFGVVVAVIYTAGPFPLAYHGLGEIAVAIAMGPLIVLGAYYVTAGTLYLELVWISIPIALMVAAILHANNIRDLDADRAANKRTLAVRFGRQGARIEFRILVIGTYVALLALVLVGLAPWPTLIAFLSLPEAIKLIRIFDTSTEIALMHQAQGRTARLHGFFGVLMVFGWLADLAIGWLLG